MGSTRKILLAGNGPYLNHGCEAIVRGTAAILSRRFGNDLEFINAAFADPQTLGEQDRRESDPRIRSVSIEKNSFLTTGFVGKALRKLHVKVPDRLNAMDRYIKGASVALEVGGDNLGLCYGLWVLRRYMELDEYLRHCGLPTVLWGASVGPFSENPEIEAEMARQLRRRAMILVRETQTQSYLASIGVEDNVRLVADPAFAMEPEDPVLEDRLSDFVNRETVGVNFSPLVAQYRSGGASTWCDIAREYVERLLKSDVERILFVPHVMVPGHNDYEFMSRLVTELSGLKGRVAILPPTLKAAEYKWVISRLRAIVAARTHATIAGFSTGVPTISLGYSVKSVGINKDIYGHTNWCIPVSEATPRVLLDKTKEILNREDEVRNQVTSVLTIMRERAFVAADCLADVLG
ncbi:MAG: polysaccharide pyruvyl transferase family protein [Armatimonadota bacterium]